MTTDSNSSAQKTKHVKWEMANYLSLMIMKRSISKTVIAAMPKTDSFREFFDVI